MRPATTQSLERIVRAPLFARVGQPVHEKNVVTVASWPLALARAGSPEWEAVRNEAANVFSECIFKVHKERFNTWNQVVQEVQGSLFPALRPELAALGKEIGAGKVFASSVEWDLTHYLVETDFADVFVPGYTSERYLVPGFYLGLGALYEEGHFPCGWEGAWPEGRLAVY